MGKKSPRTANKYLSQICMPRTDQEKKSGEVGAGENLKKLFWRVKILVFRNLDKVTVSWSLGLRERSYYQIFFDGTFFTEIQKLRFFKLLAFFSFLAKKYHRKKSDNTITCLSLENRKLAIFSLFWRPKFWLPRIIFWGWSSLLPRANNSGTVCPGEPCWIGRRSGSGTQPEKIILVSQNFGLQKPG